MRIGPARQYDRKRSLYDVINDNGGSLTGAWDYSAPGDLFVFMSEQFQRFNIPFDPICMPAMEAAATAIISHLDQGDPYAILVNLSDITMTDDWANNTYELKPTRYDRVARECDPSELETFAYVPGQAEHWFNYFLAHPGLENIPYGVGEELTWSIDHLLAEPEEYIPNWIEFYGYAGDNWQHYLRFGAWCTFLWIAGPLGRDWRIDTNIIFDICLTRGECIIYQGSVIDPKDYVKLGKPAGSCYKCSLDSWCNEIVDIDGVTRYICEFCLNDGKILYPGANCGSRLCKYVTCPRHPNHQEDRTAALYATVRSQGLLTKSPDKLLIS